MIQARWMRLAFSTLFSLVGLFRLAMRYDGLETVRWFAVPLAGLLIATVVALWALLQRSRRRWPAAVALVSAAPMAQLVLRFDVIGSLLRLELPLVVMVLGSLGTVVTALVILLSRQVAPDPIARAVAQPRSSE
jgi:hypothetical protein